MPDIESLLKEKRSFRPTPEFGRQANWNKKTSNEYRKLGEQNPTRFWAKMAKENVDWFTPWKIRGQLRHEPRRAWRGGHAVRAGGGGGRATVNHGDA